MEKFLIAVFGITVTIAAVTGEYVFGRIVLPEMSLTAPGWWIWFWGDAFLVFFLSPSYLIKLLAK